MYDLIIIGAGVTGSATAREVSRYKIKTLVLEKNEDVCTGTSKANSAIVHAGFDAETGTLMAKLNVEGNEMFPELAKELDFEFELNGSLVVCTDPSTKDKLQVLYDRGKANGVKDLRIIDRDELKKMEPNISDEAVGALYAPTGGIVCPFALNIALAENAADNGVEFRFNSSVESIEKISGGFRVTAGGNTYETKLIVNAAGLYADKFHNMVSKDKLTITPRRGDYILMDSEAGQHVHCTIFPLPGPKGKGILVTPTVHGNLIAGPTAYDLEDKEATATTAEGLAEAISKSAITVKNVPYKTVITSFAGLRAHSDRGDFIIGEVEDAPGFIDCAGIESPGLTACPAVGKMAAGIVRDKLDAQPNPDFCGKRTGVPHTKFMSMDEINELIKKDSAFGNIICRCCSVTEGEILNAIHRTLGARSLDGVKRRTGAGLGRCQAGFCSPKTMEILARELHMDLTEVTKSGGNSYIVIGRSKADV